MKGRTKLLKKITAVILLILLFITMAFPVGATPSDSYTHVEVPGGKRELHLAREMYYASDYIDARSLGIDEKLTGISDIFCTGDGKLYIVFEELPFVLVLNSDYSFSKKITIKDKDGAQLDFNGSKGIYVDNDGTLYISDTKNTRVLIVDKDGILKSVLNKPESKLIPTDFLYQPTKLAKDSNGYLYILSWGCYYGALMYNPDGEFIGFYGSNSVESNALDTLQFLWEKLTSNQVKKKASVKTLPYSFVDLDFDSDDYLVTCTGQTDTKENGKGQIKKISYNGSIILYKRNLDGTYDSADSFNYLEDQLVLREDKSGDLLAQDMVSIAVDEDNFIYALDRVNGYIYVYDNESNLLNSFGGGYKQGTQVGTFASPVSLELNGDSLLVADSTRNSITVFKLTEYGALLKKAQSLYLKGNYDDAQKMWNEVLSYDSDNQLAYRGLAMVFYNEGNYEKAMEYAKISSDYSVYDLAKQEVFKKRTADNFAYILLALIVLIALIIYLIVTLKKKKIVLILNQKLKLAFNTVIHPFDTFNDIKYKKMGSLKIAFVFTVLLYVAFFLRDTASGFLYSSIDMRTYNSIYTLGKTIGFVILWCVCNWLVCSMADGKGKLSEVFISVVYSLIPLIIYTFIRIIATNLLPLSASGIITGIDTAVWILTIFLVIVGTMTVHEYDFFKFLITGIVTVMLMILVVFVIFICALMSKQAITFIESVYTEIVYR